jgi:hypothetical protein
MSAALETPTAVAVYAAHLRDCPRCREAVMLCPHGETVREGAVACDPEASDEAVGAPRPTVDPGGRVVRAFRALMTEYRPRPWAQPGWRPPGVMEAAEAKLARAWYEWAHARKQAVMESLASEAPVEWARTGIDADSLRAAERQADLLADDGRHRDGVVCALEERDAFLRALDQLAWAFRAAFARWRSRRPEATARGRTS